MTTTVEEIVKVIEVLQQRPTGSLALFENTLAEICEYLKKIAECCEHMHAPSGPSSVSIDNSSIGAQIADALRGLQITAPPVTVEVAAPQVVLQVPEPGPMTGWTFEVVQRDEMGRTLKFRATPEN